MLSIKIAFDSEKQNKKLTITPTLPFSQARLHSQLFHLRSLSRPAEGGKRAEVSRQPLLSDIPSSSLFLLLQRGVPLTDRSACREHHSPAPPCCSQVPRVLHRRSTAELSPRFSARWAFPPQAFPPPGCGAAGGRGDTGAALTGCQRPGPHGRRRGRRVRAQRGGSGGRRAVPAPCGSGEGNVLPVLGKRCGHGHTSALGTAWVCLVETGPGVCPRLRIPRQGGFAAFSGQREFTLPRCLTGSLLAISATTKSSPGLSCASPLSVPPLPPHPTPSVPVTCRFKHAGRGRKTW